MTHAIDVGTAVNLLFGFRPAWDPTGTVASPFFSPATPPLAPQNPVTKAASFQYWSGTPLITLHASPESLLSAIYSYDVAPVANDPQAIDVPSGPLALDDADRAAALKAAGTFLGLDLKQPAKYMLVSYERCSSTTSGDYTDGNSLKTRTAYLTKAACAIVDALPEAKPPVSGSTLYDSKLTLADAKAYLAAIRQLGTHFVTEVSNGDRLVQVFQYADEAFKYLKSQFDLAATRQPDGTMAVSGTLAKSWAIYTTPKSNAGFVERYGALTTIGRDPALGKAIEKGDWASGYVPDGTPSIFAAAVKYDLLSALTQDVTYACKLTPMADLMPSALVEGPWDRLVAGGLMQKFGNAVVIPLRRPLDYDWSAIFPQTADSWASGIVTPVIDIYQERVDLAKVQMMGAEIIGETYPLQSFTSFSQVLQATSAQGAGPIALPSDKVTLISQIIDTTQAAQTPVLSMSARALQKLSVSCENMYGALIFQSGTDTGTTRKTALDGFLMETARSVDPDTGRHDVDIAGVLTDPPSPALLESHSQSVEFSVVAGEALLQAQGANAETVRGLQVAYLNWLARIIPEDTQDETLSHARVRALYLANSVADFGSDAVFVPYVTYDSYSKYVGDLVTQATRLTGDIASYQSQLMTTVASYKVMNSIANVNDNIRSIGGVLTQYFAALASGRQAMDSYYDNIIAQLDVQLKSTLQDITKLQGQLDEQQKTISNLGAPPGIVQKFEKDYVEYEKDEIFKAVMGICTGLFSLGVSFAGIPGAAEKGVLDALKALKDVYEKLQAVMKVISQLGVIESVAGKIAKINELAKSIQSASDAGNLQMPSAVDLEMIPNNVEASLANVPDNGKLQQDKADLIAAVKNLVIVGTALLSAQTTASRILVEIANTTRMKTINGQQQADMSALSNALNLSNPSVPPDLAKIDLIGMTGQLQFQLKQVLATLARTLENQNGALQFTYFGQPASITSFSLNELLSVISSQDANIINAIQQLNPQPQKVDSPITVKIASIPYKQLIDGRFKRISVHPSEPGFMNYVMVRIDRVVPRIKGVKSTASGDCEIALDTQARPFLDRDPERQTRTFVSTRRAFGPYVYDIATGEAKFGTNTGTFADKVTHITPFTDWNVSLPKGTTNKDIAFDDLLVDIEIDFYITAIYNDPVESVRRAWRRAVELRKIEPLAMLAGPKIDLESAAVEALPDSSPSLSFLEGQMYQNQAVLNGWDAAFSMLSGPVNAFLNQQFQAYIKALQPGDDSGLMTIKASYFGTPTPVSFHGQTFWTSQVTELEIQLTNPLLQFVANADQATVEQFIKGGSVKVGSVDVNGNKTTPSTFLPGDAYLPTGPLTFTADTKTNELVIAAPDVLGKGLGSIYLSTTGHLPAPLKAGTADDGTNEYYIVGWSSTGNETRIKLSDDPVGTEPIKLTDAGSGAQTLTLGVSWNDPAVVDTSKSPYVFANVQLSTIRGIVTPPDGQGEAQDTLTVTLDFPTGSFVLRNIHVEPPNWDPAPNATQISDAIANYYAQHDIKFIVQTINTKDLATDAAMTPTKFVLHAMTSNAGNNILQLLIATTGKVQNTTSIAVTEPVAYDPKAPVAGSSDFMVSLMISSELTFKHIFVDSFNRGQTGFVVDAVPPKQGYQAWSATMTKGIVNAPVPFKDSYTVDGDETQFRISASSNNLTWDISGLTFSRTETDGVELKYSNGTANPPKGGTNVNFQYRQYLYAPGTEYSPGYWYWTRWYDASAMAYVNMTGTYPLEVFNDGIDQQVKFSTTNPVVHVDKSSDLKPTAACHCDDNDVKIALMQALSTAVPEQIQKNMNQITFKPVSVMALESLLFPAEQLISMGVAKVPSATLVVGSFLAQVRKKAATYNVTIPASAGAKGSFGGVTFESGGKVNSVTKTGMPASFQFTYGPIDPAIDKQVDYTIDIEAGTINPPLIAVVHQADADGAPQDVTLLLPGYPLPGTQSS